MSKESQEQIFKSLSLPEEIRSLINSMIQFQIEILCKLPQETLLKIQIVRLEKNEFICRPLGQAPVKATAQETICSFSLGGEKHYFVTELKVKSGTEISLIVPAKFFVLQRRQNYRLKIPESYQASIQMKLGPQQMIRGRLIDLSVGGCRASFDLEDLQFKLDQETTGTLIIKGREPIDFSGVIRYIQGHTIGTEFVPFTPALESRVFALTMDLHKEFFSRLK